MWCLSHNSGHGVIAATLLGWLVAAAFPAVAESASIGINLASNVGGLDLGSNTAGVVLQGNWNNISTGVQSGRTLHDDLGVTVAGLTLSTPLYNSHSSNAAFVSIGDTALMRGHLYEPAFRPVDITFTGTIPYSEYDVYVYYNSSAVRNTQIISILNSAGQSLGLTQQAFDDFGVDSSFVLSDGAGNNANYVKFTGLTSSSIPTNFMIRAQGNSPTNNEYGYINGIQIVSVPEPASISLTLGAVIAFAAFRRRSAQ